MGGVLQVSATASNVPSLKLQTLGRLKLNSGKILCIAGGRTDFALGRAYEADFVANAHKVSLSCLFCRVYGSRRKEWSRSCVELSQSQVVLRWLVV